MDDLLKAAFVKAAQEQYDDEGTLEVDDDAPVSAPDDPDEAFGAYVQAWVWVGNPECAKCGETIEGLPVLPPNKTMLKECVCKECSRSLPIPKEKKPSSPKPEERPPKKV